MDTDDLIRQALVERLEPVDETAAWEDIRERAAAERQRRYLPLAAACVVVVLLVTGAVAFLRGGAEPSDVETGSATTVAPADPDTWRPLADGPLSARSGAAAVWTGEEMVIAGGTDAPPCPDLAQCDYVDGRLADGAAYDPATDSWRTIADAPLPFEEVKAFWTGEVMLVFVGTSPASDDAAVLAYDPATDEWSERAAPPMRDPWPLWTGDVAVDVANYNTAGDRDWAYDPATDEWRALPTEPLGCGQERQGAWAGDRLVVFWKACTTNPNSIEPSLYYGASALDLASGQWERLPDSGVAGFGPWWEVDGKLISIEVGAIDGGVQPSDPPHQLGGIFDLASGAWEPLPQPGVDVTAVAAGVGYEGIAGPWVVSGRRMFAPATGTWRPIPPPPPAAGDSAVAVWTGHEIIQWGGTSGDQVVATGAAYAPPPTP